MRQPLKADDFSDLLNVQGFSKPNKGPRTLKDMKKESDIEGAIDPDRARVCEYCMAGMPHVTVYTLLGQKKVS